MSGGPASRSQWRRRLSILAVAGLAAALALAAWRVHRWRAPVGSAGRTADTAVPAGGPAGGSAPWTPGDPAPAALSVLSVPPPAGPLPFAREETAAYRVVWRIGDGGAVPAGRAATSAAVGSGTRHFVLDVETSGWVSSLFEVRDRIETWTGADLLPSRQEQRLREGGRVTDRTTRFDRPGRAFSIDGAAPMALADGARDGLSALFYARTLPLADGYAARIPVVEGGRTYAASLLVERVERIELGGRQAGAFRMAVRLVLLPDRLETVRAVVWISADRRRVPLVVEIALAVGSFRAELDAHAGR